MRYLLLLFSVVLLTGSVVAQISDTAVFERNGRKFHRHIVEPGNTVYSISKKFGVSVKDIDEFNPDARNGLSIGDTLWIIAASEDRQVQQKQLEVDGNIIVHEVQKGQTLYAISKMYDLPVSELFNWNPELREGMKEGQLVRIPVAKLKKPSPAVVEPLNSAGGQRIHKVQPKETLYSLSVLYKVPVPDIKNANAGLPDGLKVGMDLLIPDVTPSLTEADTTEKKTQYHIGLILPFFLDENDTLMAHLNMDESETVLTKSLLAIQFYEGCKMAIDSLKKTGMNFKVFVFESANDSVLLQNMINQGRFANLDLIIGPFYHSAFVMVSDYARQNKIHIVCPVPQNNRLLLGNPYMSKVATSRNVLYSRLAKYICEFYRSQNILLVNKHFRVNPMLDNFKKDYRRELEALNDTARYGRNMKEVRWDEGSVEAIVAQLSDSAVNILILPSTDQVYVTELLSRLNHLHTKYHFKVIGVDNWLKYTNVDFEYFQNLNVMIPVEGFVDYKRSTTIQFVKEYYLAYNQFPEKYAFLGFDIMMYYLQLLQQHGTRFEAAMEKSRTSFHYLTFDYFKTGIESGYENSSMQLIRYTDFSLEKVPILE